ncbi:YeeE/YedE thiosulfate transporter family protein [Nocardioides donggukensis]|uniref:YeeE/YedE family protein n=1 Tax=Nocardioides donggukensis TaxID=2774019 RepID=A0A927K3W4_9ACTN|nr:YeeE/YedE thiosulfate transporter family protein [Nocardioides donggukensis]MBD8869331.1 YeeE/YedE family protein [Nocardioides donggukensis]
MLEMIATGALAGALMGFVLQRSDLCFHSMFAGAWQGRTRLLRGWLLGVSLASVGLSLVYLTEWSSGLNTGLAFRPVQNVVGGVIIGVGMVVARSCVSGLFYKLGAGMLGAAVGITAWVLGELAATNVSLDGPTVLAGGEAGTLPAVLGLPRLLVALVLLGGVVALLWGRRGVRGAGSDRSRAWSWPRIGVGLGVVTVAGWLLAGLGGSSFGPSTVGAANSVQAGRVNWWLVAFLFGIVLGAHLSARQSGRWRPRGENPVRFLQLAAGGFLLGAGGWIAGGCNLGHGVSGVAQLNVSSFVVVAAMALGVLAAGRARSKASRPAWLPTPTR